MNLSQSKYFPNSKWFEETFGFKETLFNVDKYIDIRESDLGFIIYSYRLNKEFLAGNFSTRGIPSFTLAPRGNGTFSIIGRLNDSFVTYSIPEFKGATFQVNTNFNCLNNISINQGPDDGVSWYIFNNINGSKAAVATAASLIYRYYYLTLANDTEINLAKNTYLPVIDGFSSLNKIDFAKDGANLNFDYTNLNIYEVGVQENCQVILTRYDDKRLQFIQNEQIIHQVFASSFNLSENQGNNLNLLADIEPYLLEAEYKLTILAAWENSLKYPDYPGSKMCFLTILGYELDNVPLDIVFRAIQSCKDLIIESGLDIYLIANDIDCFRFACYKLDKLVTQTSGRIIP